MFTRMAYENIVEIFVFILAIILATLYLIFFSSHIVALLYGRYKYCKPCRVGVAANRFDLPGVSIMKPLKGVDDNLYENLRTFFNIDYPQYELIFCVQDAADPAIDIVKKLIAEYPVIDAKLYYGGKIVCVNPKISNLCQGYNDLKYGLLLISDSGIKTTKDTLYDMVSLMVNGVGLVHQMPFVCNRTEKAVTIYEKLYYGTWQARSMLFANFIGMNCVVGMSCLMRKSVIDECGGLIHFGKYMAEDFFIANAFLEKKHKLTLSHGLAWQNAADYSISTLNERIIRWTMMRVRHSVPSWLQPLAECFLQGLYGAWIIYYFTSDWQNTILFFLLHIVIWFLFDFTLLQILEKGKFKYGIIECIPYWIYRETICYWLFFRGVFKRSIKWRSGEYKIKFGGEGYRVEPKQPSPTTLNSSKRRVSSVYAEHEIQPNKSKLGRLSSYFF